MSKIYSKKLFQMLFTHLKMKVRILKNLINLRLNYISLLFYFFLKIIEIFFATIQFKKDLPPQSLYPNLLYAIPKKRERKKEAKSQVEKRGIKVCGFSSRTFSSTSMCLSGNGRLYRQQTHNHHHMCMINWISSFEMTSKLSRKMIFLLCSTSSCCSLL